jgi:hypothetical protein
MSAKRKNEMLRALPDEVARFCAEAENAQLRSMLGDKDTTIKHILVFRVQKNVATISGKRSTLMIWLPQR